MAEALANAYQLENGTFVHASSRTSSGVWVATLPATLVADNSDPDALGVAIRNSLAQQSILDAEQLNYGEFTKPVLAAAGLKSWSQVQRKSKLCEITRTGGVISVVPTRNGGAAGTDRGFHELEAQAISLPTSATPHELGAAVLSGFERCQ